MNADRVGFRSAWPNEDGTVVVETEEEISVFTAEQPLSNFTFQNVATNTIPGVGISTNAGTDFELNPGNNVTVAATSVTVNGGPLESTVYPAEEGVGIGRFVLDDMPVDLIASASQKL